MDWIAAVCAAVAQLVSLETVVSVVIGGAISLAGSWFFGGRYYRRAAVDLRDEATKSRTLVEAVYRALKTPHGTELIRNGKGDVTGVAFSIQPQSAEFGIVGQSANLEKR